MERRVRPARPWPLLAPAALAWMLLAAAPLRHVEPIHSPLLGLVMIYAMWVTMMAAMMLPLTWPWIRTAGQLGLVAGVDPAAQAARFAAGYATVWLSACLAASVAQTALAASGGMVPVRAGSGPTGGVLILAGLFQFTRLKAACVRRCRTPFGAMLVKWRTAAPDSFGLGVAHGRSCFGCCWALMGTMLVMGAMNLVWMALLTTVMAAERFAPVPLARAVGVVLVLYGGWRLLA